MNFETENFVPFNESLDLRAIGFDEPCLKMTLKKVGVFGEDKESSILHKPIKNSDGENLVAHPLWQQATRWFRTNYKLSFPIIENEPDFIKLGGKRYLFSGVTYGADTYEEAELLRLQILIELVKRLQAQKKAHIEAQKLKEVQGESD